MYEIQIEHQTTDGLRAITTSFKVFRVKLEK